MTENARRRRISRVDQGPVRLLPGVASCHPDDGVAPCHPDDGVAPDGAPVTIPTCRDGTLPAVVGEPLVPPVGDWVLLDGPRALIAPRTAELVRDISGATSREQVIAANVDLVLIAEHLEPTPSLGRIERMLTIAWRSGATPLVVLTKATWCAMPGMGSPSPGSWRPARPWWR